MATVIQNEKKAKAFRNWNKGTKSTEETSLTKSEEHFKTAIAIFIFLYKHTKMIKEIADKLRRMPPNTLTASLF